MASGVSVVDIFNLALGHLAVGTEVQAVDEASKEANACRRYYDMARQEVLRAFPWPFATKTVSPSLVSDPTVPYSTEYQYAYRAPVDMLRMRRILSGTRQDTASTRVVYRLVSDDDGQLIITDQPPQTAQSMPAVIPQLPIIEYTWDISDPAFFQADFVMALSYLLAFRCAKRLTKGDQVKMGTEAYQLYKNMIEGAKDTSMNEEQEDRTQESSFIQVRE